MRLRLKKPGLKRPFRVPFGTARMVATVVPPILIVIFSGAVLCYVFRAICGGPGNPSSEAGNEALALAETEAAEDAA